MYIIDFIEPIFCSVEEVDITDGTVLVGGVAVMENQLVNTVITYQCDPGFMLSGLAQRTCEIIEGSINGEWSGSLPSCINTDDSPDSSFDASVLPPITVSPSATTTQIPSATGEKVLYGF